MKHSTYSRTAFQEAPTVEIKPLFVGMGLADTDYVNYYVIINGKISWQIKSVVSPLQGIPQPGTASS